MTKHKKPKAGYALPPLETILAATREDSQAMDELVSFYRPYIWTLATRELYDASGCAHTVVDEQLCRQLDYVGFEVQSRLTAFRGAVPRAHRRTAPRASVRSKRLRCKRFDRLESRCYCTLKIE